jgi:hypothetical protein
VFHPGRCECHCRVASGAIVIGQDVLSVLTCRGDVVVTTGASAFRACVVHPENGREVITRMAQGAVAVACDVIRRFGRCADAAADGVAASAIARRALEYAVNVAVLASHVPVRVAQFEAGREVVEAGALDRRNLRTDDQQECGYRDEACERASVWAEHRRAFLVGPRPLEAGGGVTFLALGAEAASMHVVFRVAATADHGGLGHVLRLDVTLCATDFGVGAGQGKAGARRMIEVPEFPAVGGVARSAVLAQLTLVAVVFGMAADTGFGCFLEVLCRVTLSARDGDMEPE